MITDFHSHILPCVDDGSRSIQESVQMLRLIRDQGFRRIVATPHFYPRYDDPKRFLQRRQEAAEQLQQALQEEMDMPRILLGAEVYFFHGISESDVLPELAIDKSDYILIEMPQPPWTSQMYRELEGIWEKQGLIPIVAHVDRYIRPFRTHQIPQKLAELPVLVQANASFFQERGTRSMAMKMLKSGHIHLLGSDCHNLTSRKPNLGETVNRIGPEYAQRIEQWEKQVLDTCQTGK